MVRPKKHLGQHFLNDKNIAEKIVDHLESSEQVLEIGPGTGVLTELLFNNEIQNFFAIEIDKESIAYLKEKYPDLKLIEGDFLKLNLSEYFNENLSIIGNFPYNISTQILFKILENRNLVNEMIGMFQKEVADRILSPPNNKTYGILSVLIQAYFEVDFLFNVGPGSFYPPPKVQSSVIRLKRNANETLDCNEKHFFTIVKKAFNQRRKTLRNSLKPLTFDADSSLEDLLTKRAENLDWKDFVYLTSQYRS